jgi:uncharacterized protein (TIGR02246 family)
MNDSIDQHCKIIDELVIAYNAHDARRFADLFTENAWHGNMHSSQGQQGREAIYQRYIEVFAMYPENQTTVIHRAAYGRFVVDHERVQRSHSSAPFDIVAIYRFDAGLIERLDFVRE